jgi:hypothetical protein
LGFYIALQSAGVPVVFNAVIDILQSVSLVFYPGNNSVMSPAQFGTQCVPNWESVVNIQFLSVFGQNDAQRQYEKISD